MKKQSLAVLFILLLLQSLVYAEETSIDGIWRGAYGGNNLGACTLTVTTVDGESVVGVGEWAGYEGGLSLRSVQGTWNASTRSLKLRDIDVTGVASPGWRFGRVEDYTFHLVSDRLLVGTYTASSVNDRASIYLWRSATELAKASLVYEGAFVDSRTSILLVMDTLDQPAARGLALTTSKGSKGKMSLWLVSGKWPKGDVAGQIDLTPINNFADRKPNGRPVSKLQVSSGVRGLLISAAPEGGGRPLWVAVPRR